MPRSKWTDYLQTHYFWAFDATGQTASPVLTPLFGFSGISAPTIQVETESFKDGTFLYHRHIVKGAAVAPVTFRRAASLYDSDFYDWITLAIHGQTADQTVKQVRRNIVVVQFTGINLGHAQVANTVFAGLVGATITAGANLGNDAIGNGFLSFNAGAAAGTGAALTGLSVGPFAYAARIPARAWLLHGCIPINYVSGSDLDANSGEISIMQLEIQPELVEEYTLGLRL